MIPVESKIFTRSLSKVPMTGQDLGNVLRSRPRVQANPGFRKINKNVETTLYGQIRKQPKEIINKKKEPTFLGSAIFVSKPPCNDKA